MQTIIAACGACGKNACSDCGRYPCSKPSIICFCDSCSKILDDDGKEERA